MNRREFLKNCLAASSLVATNPSLVKGGTSEPLSFGESQRRVNYTDVIPSGLRDLDDLTNGFKRKSVNLIVGRLFNFHKTFALQVALHNAFVSKSGTLLISNMHPTFHKIAEENEDFIDYSYEEHLKTRELSHFSTEYLPFSSWVRSKISNIYLGDIANAFLSDDELEKINISDRKIKESPLWIFPFNEANDASQIICDRTKQHDINLVVIILEDGTTDKYATLLVDRLKKHSIELNISVIISFTSYYNYENHENRSNKRLTLSDIPRREIIDKSDQIISLYRDALYNDDSPCEIDDDKELVELHIMKNNFGNQGKIFATNMPYLGYDDWLYDLSTTEIKQYLPLLKNTDPYIRDGATYIRRADT